MLRASDLVPEGYVWVSVTEDGKISRTTKDKPPRLSGKAAPNWLLRVETRDTLFLVAENGKAAALGVHKLPATDSPSDGTVYTQVSPLRSEDMLAAVFNLPPKEKLAENWFALSVTRGGMVKKSVVQDLPGPTAQKIVFSRVNDGDRLGWIFLTNGEQEVLLATAQGMSIRFSEDDVRPMGLVAAGVNGIKLKVGDEVVGAETLPAAGAVFLIRDDGNAKRVQIDQFPTQGRYGLGVQAWKMPAGSRLAGMLIGKNTQRAILHLLKLSSKAVRLDSAPIRSRPARGQVVIDLKKGDKVVSVTTAVEHPRPIEQEKPKRNRSTKKKGAKTNTQGKLL
jgi:DNA gyrase/topoisomerase IV subunit A